MLKRIDSETMKVACAALMLVSMLATAARAGDGFEAVRCGADIPAALLGKKMTDEPVVQIEQRHADLGLKDLGADEISDSLNAQSWQMCGREYVLLTGSHDVVRDVLAFPAHSRRAPAYQGEACRMNGGKLAVPVVAVLDNNATEDAALRHFAADDATLLVAKQAWKIDTTKAKFVALPAVGLRCPRGGIITVDGGP